MPNIILHGDLTTGQNGFPSTKANATSAVTINGKAIVIHGDTYNSHSNVTTHVNPTIIASSGITINGKKVALHGDKLSCGDTATATSSVSA